MLQTYENSYTQIRVNIEEREIMELTHDGYINGSHENEWNLIDLQIIDLHLEWHEWKIKEQEKHMK